MLEEEDDLGVPTLSEMLACTRRPAAMQQISTTMASSKTTVGGSKAAGGPKAIAMATPSLTPPSASPSPLPFSGMASEGSKGASDNGGVERLNCPRCDSANTKFCYYNNYSLSQPRHFCKNCKRYWTAGGTLRTVPVGGGCRRNKSNKRPSSPSKPITTTISTTMTTNTDIPSSAVGADYPSSSSENSSRIGRPYEFHHNEDIMGGGGFLELSNASHHVASPQPPSMATLGGGSTTPSFLGLLVGSGDDLLLNYDGGDNDGRLLVNPIQALVPPLGVPGTSAYFKDGEVLDSKPDISNLEDKKVDVDERDRMGFARNNFSEKDSSWSQPWGNLQRLHNNSNSNGDDNPVVMGDEGGDNAKKRLKKGGGMLDWQVSPPPVCDNFNHDPPSIVDGYWTDQLSQYPLPGSGSPFT